MKLNLKTLDGKNYVVTDVPADATVAQFKDLMVQQNPTILSEDTHIKTVIYKSKQLVDDTVLSTVGIVDNDLIVILITKIKSPAPVVPTPPSVAPLINPAEPVIAPPSSAVPAPPAPPAGEQLFNVPGLGNVNIDQLQTMMTMMLMQNPDMIRGALMQDPGLVALSKVHPDMFNGLVTDVAFVKELIKSNVLRVGGMGGFGMGGDGGGGGEEEPYHEPEIPDLTPTDHENIAMLMSMTKLDKMTVTQYYVASDKNPDIAYAMLLENGTK